MDKKIILVRCDKEYRTAGCSKFAKTARDIRKMFPQISGENTVLFCSPRDSGHDAAKALGEFLRLTPVEKWELYGLHAGSERQKSGETELSDRGTKDMKDLFDETDKEFIIAVTHQFQVNFFFRKAMGGRDFSVERGQGVWSDGRQCGIISPLLPVTE